MKRILSVWLLCLVIVCAAGLAACGGTAVGPVTPEAPGTPSEGETPGLPEETPDDIAAAYERFRAALEQNADRYSLTVSVGEDRAERKLTAKAAGDRVHLVMTYPDYGRPSTITEEMGLLFVDGFVYVRNLLPSDDSEQDKLIFYAPDLSPDITSVVGFAQKEWLPEGFFTLLWDEITVTDGTLTFAFGAVADGTLVFEAETAVLTFAIIDPYYGDRIPCRITIGGLGTTDVTLPFADSDLTGSFSLLDRRFAEMERVLASDSAHISGTAVLAGETADIEYRLSDGAVLGELYAGETLLAREMLIKREDVYFRFDGNTPDYSAMSVRTAGTTVGEEILPTLSVPAFRSEYFVLVDGREDRVVLSEAGWDVYSLCEALTVDFLPDGTYVADIALKDEFYDEMGVPLERLMLTFSDIGETAEIAFPPEYSALTEFYRNGILYAPAGEGAAHVAEIVNMPKDLVISAEITVGGTVYSVTEFSLPGSRYWSIESVVLPESITSLNDAFAGADELKYVYYEGTPEQYAAVTGKTFGDEAPVIYYYTEEAPSSGNGWHWDETKTSAVRWPGGEEAAARYRVWFASGTGWMPDDILYVSVIENAPVPEAGENYHFVGWYTDEACTPGSEAVFPYTVTEETTFYAKWEYLYTKFVMNDEGDGYILTTYDSERREITVPAEHAGLPVTGIGSDAFRRSWPTHITLPASVEYIADQAFTYMPSLLYVYIPASVTFIGYGAFYGCDNLVLYCEAASEPAVWADNNWNPNGCPVVWDCHNNDVADNGKVYLETGGIRYALSENAAVAEYAASDLTEARIPESVSYDGDVYPVTEIGAYGFDNGVLTRVEIPDTVTTIGEGAFTGNAELTEVTIPGSVTEIGAYAFSGCHALILYCEAASAPDGWSEYWNGECPVIWDCADNDTTEDGSVYAEIGGIRYALSDGVATVFDGTALTDAVTVPASVTYAGDTYTVTAIGAYAFYGSEAVSITLPDSVTEIGVSAFDGCYNLTELYIPDGVTELPYRAVAGCHCLERISLPAGLVHCDFEAFFGLDNLREVEFRGALAQWCAADGIGRLLTRGSTVTLYIDGAAVAGELVIPAGTTRIGENAFYGCPLTRVTIPDSVTEIGAYAFGGSATVVLYCEAASAPAGWSEYWNDGNPVVWDCNNNDAADDGNVYVTYDGLLYAINGAEAVVAAQTATGDVTVAAVLSYGGNTYPVTAVVENAFSDSIELTSVTLPDSVTEIGDFAFRGWYSLQSVVLGAELTRIGAYAFAGTSLSAVTLPDGLTDIGDGAFDECRITEIRIPGSVERIGEAAFAYTSLAEVVIENGVERIGNNAFQGCYDLTSIVIPESVRAIGTYAFSGCGNLTEAIFAIPDGWQADLSGDGTDVIALPAGELADRGTAASYLREQYVDRFWTCV